MKTIINLKTLLSLLSLVVLLFGSCKAGDKLGSVTQDSQISGGGNSGESVSNGLNTSLPIWNAKHSPIPEEYWGKYLEDDYYYGWIITVTGRDITFYYEDDGNLHVWRYFHVFDKDTGHWEDNSWSWPFYNGDNYINKYKNDFRLSIPPEEIIRFNRNEKGQRVLFYNKLGSYVHEDDMNK